MECPKCGHVRQPFDDAPDWQCPACQVAYAKVVRADSPGTTTEPDRAHEEAVDEESDEHHWTAARGQRIVIYGILLNIAVGAAGRGHALPDLAIQALSVGVGIFTLLGVLNICSGLGKGQTQKILFMVLSFFPVLNLIALVYLSVRTTSMLRRAGWRVGLLGARP